MSKLKTARYPGPLSTAKIGPIIRHISETVQDTRQVTIIDTYKLKLKLKADFYSAIKSGDIGSCRLSIVTESSDLESSNDLEPRNDRYFALFHRIRYLWGQLRHRG